MHGDDSYRLSRDGVPQRRVFQEADLGTAHPSSAARAWLLDDNAKKLLAAIVEMPQIRRRLIEMRRTRAISSNRTSLGKADKDHTTVRPGDGVLKRHMQDSFDDGSSTKPIRQEASEFDPSIAYEKTGLDGSRARSDKIKMEDMGEEKAENTPLATGWVSESSVPRRRLDYGQLQKRPSAEDDSLATKWVSESSIPRRRLDYGQFQKRASAENDRPATRKAKELDDTGASFSELDDDDVPEEVSAQYDQLIQQQSREEAKTRNLRSVLSRFGLGERPLVDGKKRVRWRCGCGRNLYDDFTELRPGAAAELEKWMNDSMRKHAGSRASNSQRSATLTSAVSRNAGSSGHQQTAESDISLQSLGPSTNVLPASNMNAAVAIDVNLEKCWLILCGNMKRGPDVLLTQLNLSSTPSDKSLFDDMKSVYSNFRQPWTLRSVLRGVKTIRFVQVGPFI